MRYNGIKEDRPTGRKRGEMKLFTNNKFEDVIAEAERRAFQRGMTVGLIRGRREAIEDVALMLEQKSLKDFSNDELKLGYQHAVSLVVDYKRMEGSTHG
jgi:predicted transposase YdaD